MRATTYGLHYLADDVHHAVVVGVAVDIQGPDPACLDVVSLGGRGVRGDWARGWLMAVPLAPGVRRRWPMQPAVIADANTCVGAPS